MDNIVSLWMYFGFWVTVVHWETRATDKVLQGVWHYTKDMSQTSLLCELCRYALNYKWHDLCTLLLVFRLGLFMAWLLWCYHTWIYSQLVWKISILFIYVVIKLCHVHCGIITTHTRTHTHTQSPSSQPLQFHHYPQPAASIRSYRRIRLHCLLVPSTALCPVIACVKHLP